MFTGYSPQAWKFLRDLKRNNKRDWFLKERPRYERFIVEPTAALVEQLNTNPVFRKNGLRWRNPEKALFRIYRDVRFSADKSPYKTYASFVMSRSGGRKDQGFFYLHMDPKEFFVAIGFWQPDPRLLARFRNWMVEDPKAKKIFQKIRRDKLTVLEDGKLQRLPRGFEHVTDPFLQSLLRLKHIGVSQSFTAKDLQSRTLIPKLAKFLTRAAPLLQAGFDLVDDWRKDGGDEEYQMLRKKAYGRDFDSAARLSDLQ